MVINFMGLTGPSGRAAAVLHRADRRAAASARTARCSSFFDIFNHRMVSLFYQAWEKYRFAIAYERGERDRFSHHLMDLIGIGTKRSG